jgi:hypothetical protein
MGQDGGGATDLLLLGVHSFQCLHFKLDLQPLMRRRAGG